MTNTHPASEPHGTDSSSRYEPPSRPRRPSGPAGAAPNSRTSRPAAPRCRVRIGSADAILAVVPHLLGFNPADSLVLLGIGGPHARVRLAFRYDLPEPPDVAVAADIAAHAAAVLGRQRLTTSIAVGYGPGRLVTPVVDVVLPALRRSGIKVHDVLRVENDRYWSYLCHDPACCPPDGVPFQAEGHPAAAALSSAGLTVRADRAALASTLASDESAGRLDEAIDRALRRAGELVDAAISADDGSDLLQSFADHGRRAVRVAVTMYRRGGRLTDPDEIAWLGLALTDLRVRDDAWARMDPRFKNAHQRLWTDLVRRLPAEYVPAPAALLAFTAWQAGDGALASIAIERALQADPAYSMALLIAEALHAGLPPSAARLPMTPKQVAASYGARRGTARPPSRRGTEGPGQGGTGA